MSRIHLALAPCMCNLMVHVVSVDIAEGDGREKHRITTY